MSNDPPCPNEPVIIDLTEEIEASLKRPALPLDTERDSATFKRIRRNDRQELDNDDFAYCHDENHQRKCYKRDVIETSAEKKSSNLNAIDAPLVFLSSTGNDNGVLTTNVLSNNNNNNNRTLFSGKIASTLIHFEQKDNWSCGYRNMQMLLSALLPLLSEDHMYFRMHQNHESFVGLAYAIPSILDLQRFLEESWREGFDPSGARHYGYVAQGTKSQIGAVEVSNAFTYLGIDSTVIQFIKCPESRSKLPLFCSEYFAATTANNHNHNNKSWCPYCCKHPSQLAQSQEIATLLLQRIERSGTHKHNDSSALKCSCPALPLYLQWVGHSVTIVGVEKDPLGNVPNLLIFDPKENGQALRKKLDGGDNHILRLPCTKLATRDCQIVMCSPRSLDVSERNDRKQAIRSVTAAPEAVLRIVNNNQDL